MRSVLAYLACLMACLAAAGCGGGGSSVVTGSASASAPVLPPVVVIPSLPPVTSSVPTTSPTVVTPAVVRLLPEAATGTTYIGWVAPLFPNTYEFLTSGTLLQETSTVAVPIVANGLGQTGFRYDELGFSLSFDEQRFVAATTQPGQVLRDLQITNAPRESFSVFGFGRACNESTATVYIHELRTGALGVITSIAFDFVLNCSGNPIHTVRGGVRNNTSVPLFTGKVFGVLDRTAQSLEARPLLLAGDMLFHTLDTSGAAATYTWSQLSGVPIDLSDCLGAATCVTYAPKVPLGGGTATLALDIAGAGGSVRQTATVQILSHRDTQSRAEVVDGGSIAAIGTHFIVNQQLQYSIPLQTPPAQGGTALQTSNGAYIEYSGRGLEPNGRINSGVISLMSPNRTVLQSTEFVADSGSVTSTPTGYSFGFMSNNEGGPGVAVVKLTQFDRDNVDLTRINDMALVFDWYRCALAFCESEPVRGLFWINHRPVNPPSVQMTAPATIRAGTTASATCADTSPLTPGVHAYLTRQLKGPRNVNITPGVNGAVLLEPVAGVSGYQFVLACEIIDNRGNTGADYVVVNVIP